MRHILLWCLSAISAVFAAHYLVESASDIAYEMNVPHSLIGTVVSGLGTSLPELTIALMAAKRSQGVAIGTLIGSNITDPLLSIGSASMIHPLALTDAGSEMILILILPATILCTAVALFMMRTSYEFRRWGRSGFDSSCTCCSSLLVNISMPVWILGMKS